MADHITYLEDGHLKPTNWTKIQKRSLSKTTSQQWLCLISKPTI
jgi:hypothetical protein